jgi:hypothetical protein
MRAVSLCGLLFSPAVALAATCPAPTIVSPASPTGTTPLSADVAFQQQPLGAPAGVLSQAYEASLTVDRVLLRQELARCNDLAKAAPAPGIDSSDPAAYKPRTQYDNTPWRFNMSQDGKKMTADEFSAWMKARGVRVARGAGVPAQPATDGMQPVGTEPVAPPQAEPTQPAGDQPQR